MPNVDAPFGFRPNINTAGGTPARMQGYEVAYDYATGLFSGDLVRSTGTGRNVEKVPDGTLARVLGVFAGCEYVNDSGDQVFSQYWPGIALADANKIVKCWVYDDPQLEFVAQITTLAAANVGEVYEIDATTNSGNPVTGRSAAFIDQAATTAPQVRVTGLFEGIGGINPSEYGAFAKVRCTIVSHEKATPGIATAI